MEGLSLVAAGSSQIYGRQRVIKLVREFMTREEREGSLRNQRFPILVIEGFRGSGKTAQLSTLAELLGQRVPYAWLDFEVSGHASVPQVLSALAFELSRKCPRYGALQFPRFIVGQLVMQLELDLTNHSRACQQVVDALKRQRGVDTLREVLLDTAGTVLQALGRSTGMPIEPPTSLLGIIVNWLTARAPRRIVLGSFQDWYGHRDLGLLNDPIDVLVDLNRWATDSNDAVNRNRIDEMLWAAFLADLRAEFGRGRRADERSLNCVILLDNVDTKLGRRFLNQLVQARRQRAASEQDDADPLTVVATSRGGLLVDVRGADQAHAASDNARSGGLPRITDWSHCWWLRYRLPDLTEDEVGRAVTDMAVGWGRNKEILARVVHQLAGGHPASTRLALDAIATSPPKKWVEPEVILSHRHSGASSEHSPTVEDQMLDCLLVGVSEPALRDLVTCAAAREREEALALAGQDDLLMSGQANYGEVLDPILWPADGSAGPIVLRRLLRRRLAQRDAAISPSWSGVYARLRHACRASGDEVGELYYALAEGELGFVTRRLHQRLAELESGTWKDLLTSVAEAPYQHRRREAPIDEMRMLVSSTDLGQPVAPVGQLVAALWIAADPFTDSRRRDLHLQIGDNYSFVSQLSRGGPHAVFLEAARWHRREAEWWD